MEIIEINDTNIDAEHICCAIGNDKTNKERALTKKEWMKNQFLNGLRFKRLNERGKVFIEYMPIEKVWKPIVGKNYMIINCLWVSGQFKGKGISNQLLQECINDAKRQKMNGIVVVSSDKVRPFLTDKKYYLKKGFEVVDKAAPYFELLTLRFNKEADAPQFREEARNGECSNKKGFTFIYSNQCPFMEEYVKLLNSVATSMNYKSKIIKLENHDDAQQLGSPFGTLGIYYNGKFIGHELMTEEKFKNYIKEKCV